MVLKIALIGAGLIGREHAKLLRANPRVELGAIADISEAGNVLASEYSVPTFFDMFEMLDATKPDGAIIASPNAFHVEAAMACIERGIPSLVEKPVADTLEAARQLADAVYRAGVPVLVGHQRRHSPDIAKARQFVSGGALGRLVAVNAMWMTDKPASYFDAAWRRQQGGGPLLINLIHDIDCLRFICGEIESVMAFSSNAIRAFEVEDTASVSVKFADGALGTLLMSDTAVSPYNWDTAAGQALYFPHQPKNTYVLAGTKATIALPLMDLWRHENEEGHWQHPLLRQHITLDGSRAYENQLHHFLDVIEGKAEPIVSARDGMLTLATILAITKAGKEGRIVTIDEMLG